MAIDLQRQITAHTDHHLRHPHLDGLRKGVGGAGKLCQHFAQTITHPGLVGPPPLRYRLEHQKGIGLVQPHRIESYFIAAQAGDDVAHLRHTLQYCPLQSQVGIGRRLQTDRWQALQLHDDVALVHHRHEGFADLRIDPERQQQCHRGTDHHPPRMRQ